MSSVFGEWAETAGGLGNVFGALDDFMTSDAGEDPQTTMGGADEYQKEQIQATEVPQNVGRNSASLVVGGMSVNPIYIFGGLLVVGGLIIAAKS